MSESKTSGIYKTIQVRVTLEDYNLLQTVLPTESIQQRVFPWIEPHLNDLRRVREMLRELREEP